MRGLIVLSLLVLGPGPVLAAGPTAPKVPLTADEAVRIALQHNTQIVEARASLLTAKSGMWSAYAGVLPHLTADASRSGSFTPESRGSQILGSYIVATPTAYNTEGYSFSEGVTGSWGIGNLSSWSSWSAARHAMRAAQYGQAATRASVVLSTRTQFYQVVQAMHQADVNSQALRLARDSERRVRAMYEVGSVSKSDLLNAQVLTSQAQLDSLTAIDAVTTQRILLAQQLGMSVAELGEVDSTLTAGAEPVDEAHVLTEARTQRPDLRAAEIDVRSAELDLRAAHWSRLPYVSLSGSWTPDSRRSSKVSSGSAQASPVSGNSESFRAVGGSAALNLDFFDGLLADSRVAAARARLLTSRETRDALVRNLEGQVHQAILAYEEAVQRIALAQTSVASATENQNLVQQKYNIGSATILDLINSQVQLQRAQSTLVSAMAGIQVARAQIDQVRGRPE